MIYFKTRRGEFPGFQWLGLRTFTAEGPGSIPGWGTKIPQAHKPPGAAKEKKKKKIFNKLKKKTEGKNE